MSLRQLIIDRIVNTGPITAAEFMRAALYEPRLGYYSRRPQRSGRKGDFFTSVDVGPLFGSLLAVQVEEMWQLMGRPSPVDIVEVGAGNGRLARDLLDALAELEPSLLEAVALRLVDTSDQARAAQIATLGPHVSRLVCGEAELPARITGIVYCNELLDAMPTHVVVMTHGGLQEIHVAVQGDRLVETLRPLSSPRLQQCLDRAGVRLEHGWRAEINLAAVEWVRAAMQRLDRGFLMIVDYGDEAARLYSAARASGTLASFQGHIASDPAGATRGPDWLSDPGERDLTAHVDFTSVRLAAEAAGATLLGLLDQTYFLMGLGISEHIASSGDPVADLKRRMAAKSLMLPGGLGSTHKVLLLGKGVGTPRLRGCSAGVRLT